MFETHFDVVFYDNIGMPFIGSTPRNEALGGSELELVLLAEKLAQYGKKVLIINNFDFPAYEYNVYYYPISLLKEHKIHCKNFIINRYSKPFNDHVIFENLFIYLQDIYVPEHAQWFDYIHQNYPKAIFITVSKWLQTLLPSSFKSVCIYNMIPDWVYNFQTNRIPNKYIYCSAAFKGLNETIELWMQLKKNPLLKKAELYVCNPGYDKVDEKFLKENKINFLGNLPFHLLIQEIASSMGLFYVNRIPETFCIIAALAQALKTNTHILCLNSFGALPEVLFGNPFITNNSEHFVKNFIQNYNKPNQVPSTQIFSTDLIFENWKKLFKYD